MTLSEILTNFKSPIKWLSRAAAAASVALAVIFKTTGFVQFSIYGWKPEAWLRDGGWWVFPFLLICSPALDAIRRRSERETLRPLIKDHLEDFRLRIFSAEEAVHFHRVTLFKRVGFAARWRALWPPKYGWLIAFERTGHVTLGTRTCFRAPNDPDLAEGVAGLAWANNNIIKVDGLPDLSITFDEASIQKYAEDSNCDVAQVRARMPRARSICAIPIEVSGKVWGVLVIDSRDSNLNQQKIRKEFQHIAKPISRLLGRL